MRSRLRCNAILLALSAAFLGVACPAEANVIFVTDQAMFLADTTGLTSIDFNTFATGTLTPFDTSVGLTSGPINFVGPETNGGYSLYVVQPAYYAYYDRFPPGSSPTVLQGPGSSGGSNVGALDVTVGGHYSAVGSGIYALTEGQGPTGMRQVTAAVTDLSGTYTFTITTTGAPTVDFAGFLSTSQIESIVYTGVGSAVYPNLSNFQYGTAAVPEP
jgi:hypothetical protein